MIFESQCQKTRRLIGESRDRELTSQESDFLEAHVGRCPECEKSRSLSALALSLLRDSAEPLDEPDRFKSQLVRRWRTQRVRGRFHFWSPIALGTAIGLGLMLAALQLIQQPLLPSVQPSGEARNDSSRLPEFPEIDGVSRTP